jgi:amino acid transporter
VSVSSSTDYAQFFLLGVGLVFLFMYASENRKPERDQDPVFKAIWLYVGLMFLGLSFSLDYMLGHANTLTYPNGTVSTVYTYVPNTYLNGGIIAFGMILFVVISVHAYRILRALVLGRNK